MDYIKYFFILLCFVYSLLIGKHNNGLRDLRLLQIGLFITCLADLCLIIFDYYTLGVALFCLVQIIYTLRYSKTSPKIILKRFILVFLSILTIYIITGFYFKNLDILYIFALFYVVCLSSSVLCGVKNKYPSPIKYMVMFGMILFLLCDINVALRNIPALNYQFSVVLIFIFYLPSQLLLALSGTAYKNMI